MGTLLAEILSGLLMGKIGGNSAKTTTTNLGKNYLFQKFNPNETQRGI